MLQFLLLLQALTLLTVLVLLLARRSAPATIPGQPTLTDLMIRHEARIDALDANLRAGLAALDSTLRAEFGLHRNDASAQATAGREAQTTTAKHLREEVAQSMGHLASTLGTGLDTFRSDHRETGGSLRTAIANDLQHIGQRLAAFITEANRAQAEAREALHSRLSTLESGNTHHQERLRATVADGLGKLNTDNSAKLEEMRQTVDEKLHATLHSRLTESFGQVTDQLNKVHTGLGEMSKLSEGVDGLSRIFTNVKSRGGFAEIQLGMLLRQMLAPGQFVENASVRPGSGERVEYAIRFPTNAGERLMPLDAKFPREAWDRLETAYEANLPEGIQREGRNFENAIRTEAERICGKYINPPVTTPYAVMFLPTEGLYAEVLRRESLQSEIQQKCHVTIAGPTTLAAILTSFQMGFHMLALQEKGDEVWKVLEATKTEFKTFETLMTHMEKQVGTVQNTIEKLGVRTRAINRTLREVSVAPETSQTIAFEDFSGIAGQLVASADED